MTIFPARGLPPLDALRIIACGMRGDRAATLRGCYWYVRGLRLRGRNLILAAASLDPDYYRLWTSKREPLLPPPIDGVQGKPPVLPSVVAVVTETANDDATAFRATKESLETALGEGLLQLVRVPPDDLETIATTLRGKEIAADKLWLLPFAAGDRLSPRAGALIARAIAGREGTAMLYWDEDRLDREYRADPWLKPDWDELLFLGIDYLSGASMIRADVALSAIDALAAMEEAATALTGLEELTLTVATGGEPPLHLPRILTHRSEIGRGGSIEKRSDAIRRHRAVTLKANMRVPDMLAPSFPLPDPAPTVSVIVPTRDRVELLRTCVSGLEATSYPRAAVEIIVVDNDSVEPEALDYLNEIAQRGIAVLRHPGTFNFSAMNNRAVEQAHGEFLCLLNNDIEVVEPDWLTKLVAFAAQPGVGAVGPLLLYPDRSVQHAGLAVGVGGAAGHVHRNLAVDAVGHRNMHCVTRRVTAVTAACLVVRRDHYLAVGGLDAFAFPVAFNDVDFCIKLDRAGLRNVFVADCALIHHESKSRGSDFLPANRDRFERELAALRMRWNTQEFMDPYHHPLLLGSSERMVLAP